MAKLGFWLLLVFVLSCSKDNERRRVGDTDGSGGTGGFSSGGSGPSSSSGGSGGSAGSSSGGMPTSDTGTGGTATATGGTTASGGAATGGGSGGAAGAGGDPDGAGGSAGAGGNQLCSLGDACCADDTCSDGYTCVGNSCSCIQALHGDHYLRTDGTVVYYPSQTVIEVGDSGEPLDQVTQIFQAHFYACAARSDGSVWCWGAAGASTVELNNGELGNGVVSDTYTPFQATQVLTAQDTPLTDVKALNLGSARCYYANTICAIRDDSTLWCWGLGSSPGGGASIFSDGALRKSYATQIMADASEPLTGVEQVTLGDRHACILKGGDVYCWGTNIAGALGVGDESDRPYATKVTLPGSVEPTAIKVGADHDRTCALVEGGGVFCWGYNNQGGLGIGVPSADHDGCINFCKLSPVAVLDTNDVPIAGMLDLDMPYLGTCALAPEGSLWCWGNGVGNRAVPLQVGDEPVDNVAMFTSCNGGNVPSSIRYLTRDDVYRAASTTVDQVCP